MGLVADLRLLELSSSLYTPGSGEAVLLVPRPLGKPLAVMCLGVGDVWWFQWGRDRMALVTDSMAVAAEIQETLS